MFFVFFADSNNKVTHSLTNQLTVVQFCYTTAAPQGLPIRPVQLPGVNVQQPSCCAAPTGLMSDVLQEGPREKKKPKKNQRKGQSSSFLRCCVKRWRYFRETMARPVPRRQRLRLTPRCSEAARLWGSWEVGRHPVAEWTRRRVLVPGSSRLVAPGHKSSGNGCEVPRCEEGSHTGSAGGRRGQEGLTHTHTPEAVTPVSEEEKDGGG